VTTFTKAELSDALAELAELALQAGKIIDLAIYGGSCLILVSNFRLSSEDVDAVALNDQAFVNEAARVIASRRQWPNDWLNDGVRTYLSPAAQDDVAHELFATYPDEQRPGLRVYVPTPEYMLAMKLMAMRVETGDQKDFEDIMNLMQVVGLKAKMEIIDFAAQFYPEARLSGKLRLALDDLWRAYETRLKRRDHEPPRYLGRGGPALKG
jgi:predicted nucleotidyltransferase